MGVGGGGDGAQQRCTQGGKANTTTTMKMPRPPWIMFTLSPYFDTTCVRTIIGDRPMPSPMPKGFAEGRNGRGQHALPLREPLQRHHAEQLRDERTADAGEALSDDEKRKGLMVLSEVADDATDTGEHGGEAHRPGETDLLWARRKKKGWCVGG